MTPQVAAFLRTTLPIDLSQLPAMDSGRYHTIWLPDHMVSFWPDAIWTPEFTDLATVSHSPHRYVDSLAVAAAVAVRTERTPIATCVVDTVRRHPAMLAQTALTIDHLSKGRFILGVGSGEAENIVPYGFDYRKPVSRFEEALKVIRLLWSSDGPVDFQGEFYQLHHARLDTEPYEGRHPPIWIGAARPRMLDLAGRYADGWWSAGGSTPEDYAAQYKLLREAADRAGRDPAAITPALLMAALIGEPDELAEVVEAPLVKSFIMLMPGSELAKRGFSHPFGDAWGGMHELDPTRISREVVLDFISKVRPEMILSLIPHGTPKEVALQMKGFFDAGLRVPAIMNYSAMAGLKFAAAAPARVRETEDELMRLVR